MTDLIDVTLDKMVYGGDCLGRLPDGRAVFVPFTLPGETVRVELLEDKKRYARAQAVEILTPSPLRIVPRCQHFGACGGCAYQHTEYTHQLSFKKNILTDQLERIGKIENPPVNPPVPSPAPWLYRNYVQFHLSPQGELGYIHVDGVHVLPIRECHLPEKPINQLWPQIDLEPDLGVDRLGIRVDTQDNIMLILEGEERQAPEFSVDIPVSAVYTPPDARLTVMAGEDHLMVQIKHRLFHVSARSFFQVNTPMAEKMVETVLDLVHISPDSRVIELFAGVGLFSAFLAEKAGQLTAIEESGAACHDFTINLKEFDNVVLYEAPVEDVLPALNLTPDLIVMDPPRAGLSPEVRDALVALAPIQLVYVSCDPATLARDAKRLIEKGYRLLSVSPFDLFPQTSHIESISVFERIPED